VTLTHRHTLRTLTPFLVHHYSSTVLGTLQKARCRRSPSGGCHRGRAPSARESGWRVRRPPPVTRSCTPLTRQSRVIDAVECFMLRPAVEPRGLEPLTPCLQSVGSSPTRRCLCWPDRVSGYLWVSSGVVVAASSAATQHPLAQRHQFGRLLTLSPRERPSDDERHPVITVNVQEGALRLASRLRQVTAVGRRGELRKSDARARFATR